MSIFEAMNNMDHEQIVFCRNEDVGLNAIIGIHSTVLGPSLGGLRLYPYRSETDAIKDVMRLSRGMTYKAAADFLNENDVPTARGGIWHASSVRLVKDRLGALQAA